MYPIGENRLIYIVGDVGVTTITVRPEQGKEWLILHGGGNHNDIASRACSWTRYDVKNGLSGSVGVAFMAADAGSNIYDMMGGNLFHGAYPIKLTNSYYLVFTVAALGGTKVAKVVLDVIERPENTEALLVNWLALNMGWLVPAWLIPILGNIPQKPKKGGEGAPFVWPPPDGIRY